MDGSSGAKFSKRSQTLSVAEGNPLLLINSHTPSADAASDPEHLPRPLLNRAPLSRRVEKWPSPDLSLSERATSHKGTSRKEIPCGSLGENGVSGSGDGARSLADSGVKINSGCRRKDPHPRGRSARPRLDGTSAWRRTACRLIGPAI